MAHTCQYHEHGQRIHAAPATHAAIGARDGGPWAIYDAVTRGSAHTPEFCLMHALDVATARTDGTPPPREEP
jgi:hypothetical protein